MQGQSRQKEVLNYQFHGIHMKRFLLTALLFIGIATAGPGTLLGLRVAAAPDYLRKHYAAHIPQGTGLIVCGTAANTPAAAVLKEGDIILSINDKLLRQKEELTTLLQNCRPGDELKLRILRLGEVIELNVTLAERPAQPELSPEQTSELNRLILQLCPQEEDATVDVPAVRRQMLRLAELGLAQKDEYSTCTLYMAAGEVLICIKSTERSLTIRNNSLLVPDVHLRANSYARDDARLHDQLTHLLLQAEYYRP